MPRMALEGGELLFGPALGAVLGKAHLFSTATGAGGRRYEITAKILRFNEYQMAHGNSPSCRLKVGSKWFHWSDVRLHWNPGEPGKVHIVSEVAYTETEISEVA